MEKNFNEIQELSIDALVEISGGELSLKTVLIGTVVTAVCPVAGLGYWVGYYVNTN